MGRPKKFTDEEAKRRRYDYQNSFKKRLYLTKYLIIARKDTEEGRRMCSAIERFESEGGNLSELTRTLLANHFGIE